jgi:hypothetical protein
MTVQEPTRNCPKAVSQFSTAASSSGPSESRRVSLRRISTQNYWATGLWLSPGFLNIQENTTFQKLDLFPFSGEGRETHTLLGPLESANLHHWTLD